MATNFYKQQQRRFDVARNFERSLGSAKGAPLFVRTMEAPVVARPITIISTVLTKKFGRIDVLAAPNAPRARTLKNGRRRIIYK